MGIKSKEKPVKKHKFFGWAMLLCAVAAIYTGYKRI